MTDAKKALLTRLLAGSVGLMAVLLSIIAPVTVFWSEANEAEGLRNAGLWQESSVCEALGVLLLGCVPALLLAGFAYILLRFTLKNRADYFRWLNAPLAILVGVLSGWVLFRTLHEAYWQYYLDPKLKAMDAYIYPQMRYTILSAVVILFCADGLVACILLAHDTVNRRTIQRWSYRTTSCLWLVSACRRLA